MFFADRGVLLLGGTGRAENKGVGVSLAQPIPQTETLFLVAVHCDTPTKDKREKVSAKTHFNRGFTNLHKLSCYFDGEAFYKKRF